MTDLLVMAGVGVWEAAVRWVPVVALALVLSWSLWRRPARERHAIWLIALLGLALLPAVEGRLPWTIPAESAVWTDRFLGPEGSTSGARGEGGALSLAPSADPGMADMEAVTPLAPERPPAGAELSRSTSGSSSAPSRSVFLSALWALIATMVLAYELFTLAAAGTLARGATEVDRRELPFEMGTAPAGPRVLSGEIGIPFLFGLRQPRILLPRDWRCWPQSWLRAVILHECAHADRSDLTVQAAARFLRAVFWFHPGVWLAVWRLQREAEQATDDRVLSSGMDPFDYAEALLGLGRHFGGRRIPPACLPMAARGGLRSRLLRVVSTDPARRVRAPRAAMAAAVAPVVLASVAAAASVERPASGQWLERSQLEEGGTLWRAVCPPNDGRCAEIRDEVAGLLRGLDGGGAVAVQEVRTGRVLVYVSVDPGDSLPPVPSAPLAAAAVLPFAAAWWEAGMGDRELPCPAVINLAGVGSYANTNGLDTGLVSVPREAIALQCATAVIGMGWYLMEELGYESVARPFGRWGFAPDPDDTFWADPLTPGPASPDVPPHRAGDEATWMLAGSAHGSVRTTPLHLTRFLQAVANGGSMIPPSPPAGRAARHAVAFMSESSARKVLAALPAAAEAVGPADMDRRNGSVRGVVGAGAFTTDGEAGEVFAGLSFDDHGMPDYAVAVWLPRARHDDDPPKGPSAASSLAERLIEAVR